MMAFALFYTVGYAYAPVSPAPRKWDATHPSLPLSTSFPSNGTIFSAVFGDGAVLQRGSTTRAVLYGAVYGATAATTVTLMIAEKGAAAYSVSAMVVPVPGGNGNVTWKALLKPHAAEGGVITATASCSSCSNTAAATLHDLTYGDVWFCSGQSNMWLPMEHSLTRNRSYAAVDATPKEYSNIRTFKRHQMVNGGARFDGDELWIYQPTDAVALKETWWGGDPTSSHAFNSTNLADFSAACWYFAQSLTDIAIQKNETPPILGMVQVIYYFVHKPTYTWMYLTMSLSQHLINQ